MRRASRATSSTSSLLARAAPCVAYQSVIGSWMHVSSIVLIVLRCLRMTWQAAATRIPATKAAMQERWHSLRPRH